MNKFFNKNKSIIATFVIIILVSYMIGIMIVNTVDKRMSDISINMPKITITDKTYTPNEYNIDTDIANGMEKEYLSPTAKGMKKEYLSPTNKTIEYFEPSESPCNNKDLGCNTDSDCNVVNGNGKNVCKSDNTCYCVEGSGRFCHYGPTNFQDPKNMTDEQRKRFKDKFRSNMTLQDYKNWLMLYKNDQCHLRDHHKRNLKILLKGGQLKETDIPGIRAKAPINASDYFEKMYKSGMISIHYPDTSVTGAMVGSNYDQYDDFIPPELMEQTWLTGKVDMYKDSKINAHALNYFIRPEVTTGEEEAFLGERYKLDENVHNLDGKKDLYTIKTYSNINLPEDDFRDKKRLTPDNKNINEHPFFKNNQDKNRRCK